MVHLLHRSLCAALEVFSKHIFNKIYIFIYIYIIYIHIIVMIFILFSIIIAFFSILQIDNYNIVDTLFTSREEIVRNEKK